MEKDVAQISFEPGDIFRFGRNPFYGVVLQDGGAVMIMHSSAGTHQIEKGSVPENAFPIQKSDIERLRYEIQLALRLASLAAKQLP